MMHGLVVVICITVVMAVLVLITLVMTQPDDY